MKCAKISCYYIIRTYLMKNILIPVWNTVYKRKSTRVNYEEHIIKTFRGYNENVSPSASESLQHSINKNTAYLSSGMCVN